MKLNPGAKLGWFEIILPLGAGGMGEVYRARDTRLDRDVAIKVLPESMAQDKERLLRFEREAKLLASLNHPNIAAIYGLEAQRMETGAIHFLVLEYVEGESLAQRLKRGPLPVDEAIEAGRQIAEALDAAHEKGVIHRDLKPANVMVKPDGTAKVLDFGLARALSDDSSVSSSSDSPTITANFTKPGVVLGSAAYMSPEQARGRALDKRTDIWSFGAVLYECLTGELLFRGETASDSMGAILHREITFEALPAGTPRAVESLLRRCLQRDRRMRLQSAGDARIELEEAARAGESGAHPQVEERTPRRRSLIWPAAAALLAIALGVSLWRNLRSTASTHPAPGNTAPVVTEMVQLTDLPGVESDPSLSPDGKMLVYVARDGRDRDIFIKRVGGETALNLTADSPLDDHNPAMSPDATRIAFRSEREGGGLFVMGATGESPRRVTENGFDPAWSPDGSQLTYTTENVRQVTSRATVAHLWTIDLKTLERRRITETDAVAPAYSPSGKLIAYWGVIDGIRDIYAIPAEGGAPLPITHDTPTDWCPFFSTDGRTLYFISDRSGNPDLWRVAIDPDTGRTLGPFFPVTAGAGLMDEAAPAANVPHIAFTVPSVMGQIDHYAFDPEWESLTGEGKTIHASTTAFLQFDVTEDGRRFVYRTRPPIEDIVVMNTDGTGRRRLTDDVARDRGPRWTLNDSLLVFYSNRSGPYGAWCIRPDGTGIKPLVPADEFSLVQPIPSADATRIVAARTVEGGQQLLMFNLDPATLTNSTPITLPTAPGTGFSPGWFSPDGQRVLGLVTRASGVNGHAVYTIGANTVTILKAPDGGEMQLGFETGGDWIDIQRVVVWDETRGSAFVCNVDTGAVRELRGLQGPCDIRVVEQGRTILTNRARQESDIWMLRLAMIPDVTAN